MTYETILYDLDEGLALITLNRPEKYNALNTLMRAELADAVKRISDAEKLIKGASVEDNLTVLERMTMALIQARG